MQLDLKSLADLSEDDLAVLRGLSDVGSATPIDLAVRMRRVSDDLEPRLKKLRTKGLVEVKEREQGYEREIYRISSSGRVLLNSSR